MTTVSREVPLVYAHIGDLHIDAAQPGNAVAFAAVAEEITTKLAGCIDFVYLPGDNANNGKRSEYVIVHGLVARMEAAGLPVHVITGDHDMTSGSLRCFYAEDAETGHSFRTLPYAVNYHGVRCLFLDLCGTGRGGKDFRFDYVNKMFVRRELRTVRPDKRAAIFLHTYPADLTSWTEQSDLNTLMRDPAVRLLDMGHSHYNEIANDGHAILTTTRSTGQVEEGPVGYSLVALDGDVVSWRFKPLEAPLPFVLITTPADCRLVTSDTDNQQIVKTPFSIQAMVFGGGSASRCEYQINADPWVGMTKGSRDGLWIKTNVIPPTSSFPSVGRPFGRSFRLTVRAFVGRDIAQDQIEVLLDINVPSPPRFRDGSDKDSIGAWPGRHILGTQLGPNRNGRGW